VKDYYDLVIAFSNLFLSNHSKLAEPQNPEELLFAFQKIHPSFLICEQQDCHEFLMYLIDDLTKGLTKLNSNSSFSQILNQFEVKIQFFISLINC